MNRKITYFPGFILLVLVFWSCGSQRKNPIAKTFHNAAAHFNYHYNGELKYKEGLGTINSNYKIPPEGYVPVMVAGTDEDAKSVGPTFEEAQKKAEIGLLKHPNAKCKDDFRFLIGKAWFYRHNFFLAQQNFEYILKEYPKSKLKPDVLLWLVKTHFMNDNEDKAREILNEEVKNLELNNKQKGHLALIKAQMALAEKNNAEAIKVLEDNSEFIKGKNNRARVHFLMGQLYAEEGKFSKSEENYRIVSRMNTDYEFVFNSKLRIARLYTENQEGADESQAVYKMLRKMARDGKNLEFKDQIYYEMALLDLKKLDQEKAIKDLNQSILFNTSNQRQKALSYYKIGQIYFYEKKDYLKAEAYYDSASVSITKNAPEYEEISSVSKTLKEYVGYLTTIAYQDSMVWLAKLDSNALEKQIDRIIALEKQRKAEKQQKEMEEMNSLIDPNLFNQQGNRPQGAVSSWPFENPEQVSQGRLEFQRLWGQRKNEDNWNRKNKALTIAESEDVTENVDSNLVAKYGADRAKYYKDIPKNGDEVLAAKNKVVTAMYNLAQLYNNKLHQADSAEAVFKRLIHRFPEHEFALKSQYALYKIYQKTDPYLAAEYKERICKKDPTSIYCRLCKNENVQEDLNLALREYQSAYNALFETYNKKEYKTALNFSNFVIEKYYTHEKIAQTYYVRGLTFEKLGQRDSLRKVFTFIKSNFPDAEVTPIVIRTLAMMDKINEGGGNKTIGENKPKAPELNPGSEANYEGFVPTTKVGENVFACVLVDKKAILSPQLQIKINAFNNSNFAADKLSATVFLYNDKQHLAYISQFENFESAFGYVNSISENKEIGDLAKSGGGKILFITPENFRIAFGQKRFEDYISYYENVLVKGLNGN